MKYKFKCNISLPTTSLDFGPKTHPKALKNNLLFIIQNKLLLAP